MIEHELDTSGTVCPMPAFSTKKKLKELAPGDTLVVTGDFPEAVSNIMKIAIKNGAMVLEKSVDGGRFAVKLQVKN